MIWTNEIDIETYDLWNCEGIHCCCFKTPSLQSFITITLGNEEGAMLKCTSLLEQRLGLDLGKAHQARRESRAEDNV